MKISCKSSLTGILLAGLCMASMPSMATVIASDSFDYENGALNGQNGGLGWGEAWNGNLNVENGQVITAEAGEQGSFRQLENSIAHEAGTSVLIAFDIAADSTLSNDFTGISFFNGDEEELFFGLTFNTNVYGINWTGIYNGDTGPAASTSINSLLGEIIFGDVDTIVNLFVNPDGGLTQAVDTFTFATDELGGSFDRIRIAGNVASTFDNLSISVVSQEVSGPAVLSLFSLGLLFAGYRRLTH